MNRKVRSTCWMLAGVVAGAATAAIVVILFAPESGEEIRAQIEHRLQEVVDAGQRAAEIKRLELSAELEAKQAQPM